MGLGRRSPRTDLDGEGVEEAHAAVARKALLHRRIMMKFLGEILREFVPLNLPCGTHRPSPLASPPRTRTLRICNEKGGFISKCQLLVVSNH